MNRRGFFNSLSLLTGAALVAPQVFIPKLTNPRWKRSIRGLIVPNPDYINAEYELEFFTLKPSDLFGKWAFNIRGNEFDNTGQLISIPPYILT